MDAVVNKLSTYILDSNPTTWIFVLAILLSIVLIRRSNR